MDTYCQQSSIVPVMAKFSVQISSYLKVEIKSGPFTWDEDSSFQTLVCLKNFTN